MQNTCVVPVGERDDCGYDETSAISPIATHERCQLPAVDPGSFVSFLRKLLRLDSLVVFWKRVVEHAQVPSLIFF